MMADETQRENRASASKADGEDGRGTGRFVEGTN